VQYLLLDFTDGQYGTRPLNLEEALKLKKEGHEIVRVSAAVWAAWEAHLAQGAVFQALWRGLDNDWHREREEQEAK